MATTAGYHHPSRGLKSGTKVLVKRVETMGFEPTTPCLQTMGWTVQERPGPS